MFDADLIIPIVAILAVFGPAFYIIYLIGKLIRYRIDKKYKSENSTQSAEFKEFMENTEQRLRVLEAIVSEDEEPPASANTQAKNIAPDREEIGTYESDIWEEPKSKLKNQLKS